MPVMSSVTLNSKAYQPRGRDGDVAKWALVGDASFGGATSTITESVRGPSKDGVNRVQFKLTIPKAAASDSACACTGQKLNQAIFNIEGVIPDQWTAAEREDAQLRATALAASTFFVAAVKDLNPAY
ncbi:TPA_asm: coat protein [ssRNA phage SRR6960540_1]|uniref:Coat protein n=1 Tax=ssRNA phage SRR6960540_1 TaxID=2786537 RepID=A0A8S5L048_9VIRU|nr:coat protein [ssRNA phage SRR6960540_1]DAD51001.1 TPA_asm: coat protein [ssRNA phage SRR6960540_1]